MVRSATATPRWRSRLRCCAGDSAWSKMHRFGLVQLDQLLQLVGLARADEEGGVGRLAARDDARDGDVAGRFGEQRELVERLVEVASAAEVDADQDRPGGRRRRRADGTALTGIGLGRGTARQEGSDADDSGWVWKFTARPGTTVEIACL